MSRRDAIRSWRRAARRSRRLFGEWYANPGDRLSVAAYAEVQRRYSRVLDVTRTPHMVIIKVDKERGELTYEHRGYESVHAKLGDSPWSQP